MPCRGGSISVQHKPERKQMEEKQRGAKSSMATADGTLLLVGAIPPGLLRHALVVT